MEDKWKTVYLLEIYDASDDHIAFDTIEDAYDYAYNYLIDKGYDPTNDVYEVFKDLKKNVEPDYFYVDEVLWCYSIPYMGSQKNN